MDFFQEIILQLSQYKLFITPNRIVTIMESSDHLQTPDDYSI